MRLRLALASSCVLLAALASVLAAPAERRAVVFYTGAVHGMLEPCGCTSDPLGDIARLTGLVRREVKARAGAVLLVDAGNLSYPLEPVPPNRREAADLKAAFLARELGKLPFGGSAVGESDLARGPDKVAPARLAANLAGAAFAVPAQVRRVGGIAIGVFGVADPEAARAAGLAASDPVAAARQEAERLRKAGAEVVIALAPLERPLARQVARAAAVDFVVLGRNVGDGLPRAEQVGQAYLVAAAAELQRVGRLEIVLRGAAGGGRPALVDAGGEQAAKARIGEIERRLALLDAELARWQKDRTADGAFLAVKRKERDELRAERARLDGQDWKAPQGDAYFTNEVIPLRRALPRDGALAAAMRRLDQAVGAANLKTARPPPKAEPGRASFVGDDACARCHKPEMQFWKTTVHARAWKTIVVGGKTGHDDCVSCHVTGYGEIGGSSLGHVAKLTNVQCESCHGPGSLHVAQEGLEEPPAVKLQAPESLCVRCHNEKHSDTFQYQAYLRDVLGPGHGEKARETLGAGPTGRELRRAAVDKAKLAGEALRKRM